MKEEKENSIDKLFSQGLSDPGSNAQYREEDWSDMEALLDQKKPNTKVRTLMILVSTIAAMLLLVFSWIYLSTNTKTTNKTPQVVKSKPQVQKNSGKYGPPVQQLADLKSSTLSANHNSMNSANELSRKSKSFFTLSAAKGGRKTAGVDVDGTKQPVTTLPAYDSDAKPEALKATVSKPDTTVTANIAKTDNIILNKADALVNVTPADTVATNKKQELVSVMDDVRPNKKAGKTRSASGGATVAFKPRLALSLIASPDVNSVKGVSPNKIGTNAGLLLTVGVTRKWSVSTGMIYADKPYVTDFTNYATAYKFDTNPQSVTASCTVLDIPLNIGYQVYSKGANKFSIGTGLSSYIMLRENYTFNYADANTGEPATYNIRNSNQHILGILNLNATYQRAISSKLGLGVQPYYKVPLTGIGYGKVGLKSAGVAVGVTWNINPGTKP
jgi:hypothetical protein